MADKEFKATLSLDDKFSSVLDSISRKTNSFENDFFKAGLKVEAFTRILDGLVNGLKTVGNEFYNVGKVMITNAAYFEQQQIAFETILGSADKANAALARIKADAKRTPFEFKDLIEYNKRLIGAGLSAERSENLILALGDAISATGGTSYQFQHLVWAMQQTRNTGKLLGQDIMQFGNAGIDIIGLLADSMHMTREEVDEWRRDNTGTFVEVEKAMLKASSQGGKYFNAMNRQSTTFNGIMSNIKDNIFITTTEIAQQSGLFDIVKGAANGLYQALDRNRQTIINFTSDLISLGTNFAKGFAAGFKQGFDEIKIAAEGFKTSVNTAFDALGVKMGTTKTAQEKFFASGKSAGETFAKVIAAIIKAIGEMILYIAVHKEDIKTAFNDIKTTLDAILSVIHTIISATNTMKKAFEDAMKVGKELQKVGSSVTGKTTGTRDKVLDLIGLRASGGPITAGQPYIVGEKGPELIVPNNSGTVIPNNKAGGMTFNIDLSGSMITNQESFIAALKSEIMRSIGRQNELNSFGLS